MTLSRRTVLCACLGAASSGPAWADADDDPVRSQPPQPGDLLISSDTDQNGGPLKPSDIKPADDPVLAWAFDPAKKVPRDGTRLNQILLMRFDPPQLSAKEKALSADGVVAFSAICTHQACTITEWLSAKQVLQCPCHQSQYDPKNDGAAVSGPAPRALPALPLKLHASGTLELAAQFSDRVGGEKQAG
ncbi:MAG: Rieske (2Fe-2S) protein [Pseudomonadota bacterium]|nr:Rieske (2Fe-2S) protein [Pseudomonadota bacterium]